MALFDFPWLRNFIRRNTRPIGKEKASRWKSRLSVAYAILAWHAFGIVCYAVATGKADWAKYHGLVSEDEARKTSAQHYADKLGIKNATVFKISSLEVKKYEIQKEQFEEEKVL